MTIRFKLILSLSLLGAALLALGGSGFTALQLGTEKTSVIVTDGVEGLGELTRINDMYSNVVRDTQGVVLGELTPDKGLASLNEAFAQIDKDWRAYLDGKVPPNAASIVSAAKDRMAAAQPNVDKLLEMMKGGDLPGITDFAKTKLGDTIESIASQFDQLATIQIGVAAADFTSAQTMSSTADWVMAAVAAFSAAVLLYALFIVLRGVLRPLNRMEATMRQLAGGETDVEVPYVGRRDEVGRMASAVEVFRHNAEEVRHMTDAEAEATLTAQAARKAMMQNLQREFGHVVDAAIAGDFSQRVMTKFDDHELRVLAGSVNNLVGTVDQGMTQAASVLTALAKLDLTRRFEGSFSGAFSRLKDDTNAVADTLSAIVEQLRNTSGSLKAATGEILSGANDLSERTTKQASTVEETSAAVDQLANTVRSNAESAEGASDDAASITRTAEQSRVVMIETTHAMEKITASSAKISNIVGVIDDIAFQTNLLALNASVEAARAGDAGRGFAVVAVEVRRLAQSAAQASGEIKALIEASTGEVNNGSRLVIDAAAKLEAIVAAIRANNDALGGIAKASRAQSSSLEEVRGAIKTMDEMTQHNAALVEETNAAIEQTEARARDLDLIVERFVIRPSPIAISKRRAAA